MAKVSPVRRYRGCAATVDLPPLRSFSFDAFRHDPPHGALVDLARSRQLKGGGPPGVARPTGAIAGGMAGRIANGPEPRHSDPPSQTRQGTARRCARRAGGVNNYAVGTSPAPEGWSPNASARLVLAAARIRA